MGADTSYPVVARNLVIVGLGLGSALSAFVVATQNAVSVTQMGVATALGTFARAMGASLGSAGFGSLLAARIGSESATGVSGELLVAALQDTFLVGVAVLAVGALLVLALFEEVPPRSRVVTGGRAVSSSS
jgi:hypothetical protein